MGGFGGISLPNITEQSLDDAKERRQILNYLSMLEEKLRYLFSNISIEDNFSEAGKQEYQQTVYKLEMNIEDTATTLGNKISRVSDDVDDCFSEIEQTNDRISLVVKGDTASSITLTEDMIQLMSAEVRLNAEMKIYDTEEGNKYGGYLCYGTGDNGEDDTIGVMLSSKDQDSYFIATDGGVRMTYNDSTAVYCSGSGAVMVDSGDRVTWDGNFYCDNEGNLGKSKSPWDTLYAQSVPIEDSDRNKKNSISYDIEKYEELFKRLKPAVFKLNSGKSGRLHMGMISQDVEDAMNEIGMDSMEFAGFVKSPRYGTELVDGKEVETDEIVSYDYALRYGEFTSLNTHMIQKLMKRVDELENKLEALS